jgi:hypothetical protein
MDSCTRGALNIRGTIRRRAEHNEPDGAGGAAIGVPTQPPLLQASPTVHGLPSLQAAVLLVWTQPAAGENGEDAFLSAPFVLVSSAAAKR